MADKAVAFVRARQLHIEVHHLRPVHTMKPGEKTKLADLALLCSNCHRMAHRGRTPLPLVALIAALKGSK